MKLEVGMYVRTKWGIAQYLHNLVTKTMIYRVVDKKIVYENIVDSSLIGGIKVLANDTLINLNTKTSIDNLKNSL